MTPGNYEEAGVSIERGDAFAEHIARIPSAAVGALGGFAGGVELDLSGYTRPVLLTATDGVGTKLLVAKRLGRYDTIGIDLVAMCANDLAVCGAQPLLFLDYIACGRIDTSVLHQVIQGIVRGCERAGCTLAGGETAELPDMYGAGEIDLAGFATGIVERDAQLPRLDAIRAGDLIVGLPSSGIHSNGLSLARRLLDNTPDAWEALLVPTRIYVQELMDAHAFIKAAAHVTGGGLSGNLARVIPDGLKPLLDWDWPIPEIFTTIQRTGDVEAEEMRRVFNMGIGIAMIVAPDQVAALSEVLDESLIPLGTVARG